MSVKECSDRVEELIKNFENDRDIVKFGNGIEGVAEKLNTSSMYLYMRIADYMNLKANNGKSYECEEAKSGKADCVECVHFMHEADTCIGNSVITPVYRITHPDYQPPHFEKSGKKPIIIIEKISKT